MQFSSHASVLATLAELREDKAKLEAAIASLEALLPRDSGAGASKTNAKSESKNIKSTVDFSGMSLVDSVVEVLRRASRDMSTAEIAEELQNVGVETNSSDFKNVVSTMLHRYKDGDKGIISTGRAMWGLNSSS